MTRWEELTGAMKSYYKRLCDDQFAAGQIAASIGNNFGDYIGARDRIRFYKYEPGDTPKQERFTPENLSINSVSQSEDGRWQFGLGAMLELAPNAVPMFEFKWPVMFNLNAPHVVEVPPFKIRLEFDRLNTKDAFEPLSKALYQAIVEGLRQGATGAPNQLQHIGFGTKT
jgi:hypothetical protein